MNPLAWLTDIPIPKGSPTRVVRRAEAMAIFKKLARVRLNVTDADVFETINGVEIRPRDADGTLDRRLGFEVTPTGKSGGGFYIEPCTIAGTMPELNGRLLDDYGTNGEPPVLYARTEGIIGVWFLVGADTIEAGFRPVAAIRKCEIGWDNDHGGTGPKIVWGSHIIDTPPAMNNDSHQITEGWIFLPIAVVSPKGITPVLTAEPVWPASISFDLGTRTW